MSAKPARLESSLASVTPYLIVDDVAAVAGFLKAAFDAVEIRQSVMPDGILSHVAMGIGDSTILASKPTGIFRAMPCTLYLHVQNCDAVTQQALAAGGALLSEPEDKPYGHRNACVQDPFGSHWWIATPLSGA